MADVARIPLGAVEEPTSEHDAAAHPGGDDHADEVLLPRRGAHPALAEGERLGVVVNEDGETGRLLQPAPEREMAPRRDVERRDLLAAPGHGAAAPGPADHGGRREERLDQAEQGGEQHLGVGGGGGRRLVPVKEDTVPADDAGRQLGAADVDRQSRVHRRESDSLPG